MSNYLIKYKGKYRLKVPIDEVTNDFPKKLDGTNEDIDMYIDCRKGKIFHYGHGVLEAYNPKLGAGRNILKALGQKLGINIENYTTTKEKKDGTLYQDKDGNIMKFYDYDNFYNALEKEGTIWDIEETDEEVLFKFKDKNIELIAEFMLPKTSGAKISPFSSKNLPKIKYEIPLDEIQEYKNITSKINKSNILIISQFTKEFISKIPKINKEFMGKDMKAEQKKSRLKGKEFIHSIKMWDEYIKFLNDNIKEG